MAERLDPEVRRARIIDTAMAMIAEEGYRGLTLRSLARRCGMSAPGLMHYFHDLPTLLMEVLDERDRRDDEEVRAAVSRGASDGDTVAASEPSARELLDQVVAQMARNPAAALLFATLQAESLDPSHPAHRYFLERTERLVGEMHDWIAPEFADSRAAVRQIAAILDGLQLQWLRDREGFNLEENWAAIADRLFAPPQPTSP